MVLETSLLRPASLDEIDYLLLPDRGWAWEWLRRSPEYRSDVQRFPSPERKLLRGRPEFVVIEAPSTPPPTQWHLQLLEHPDCHYGNGAIFWDSAIDVSVLSVTASALGRHSNQNDTIDFFQFELTVKVLKRSDQEEHVLISDGTRSIQLHVVEGTILQGPVRLAHVMSGSANPRVQIQTIERLTALRALGRFPLELFPPDPRASRWLLALKAYDLSHSGSSLKDIAEKLYYDAILTTPGGAKSDWPKSRVRRLLNTAQKLVNGGYIEILSDN